MCGRFQIAWPWAEIVARYGVSNPRAGIDHPDADCVPRLNVGPTYKVPVVCQGAEGRELVAMRWGFPATWLARQGKDPWSRQLFNAKAEAAASKATWKKPLAARRCLVPATGFYEWLRKGRQRFPLLWTRSDAAPLALAGLWGRFTRDGETVERFSILTAGPSRELAHCHDRGPVIVAPVDWDRWLDPQVDAEGIADLLRDVPDGLLDSTPVSTALNDIKRTGPELMVPDWDLVRQDDGGLAIGA